MGWYFLSYLSPRVLILAFSAPLRNAVDFIQWELQLCQFFEFYAIVCVQVQECSWWPLIRSSWMMQMLWCVLLMFPREKWAALLALP